MDRRTMLRGGLAAAGGTALALITGGGTASARPPGPAPALLRRSRPRLTHGVQSGDVTAREAVVWARSDRPARMLVEVSRRPDLRDARTVRGPLLTPHTDLTGKTLLRGLPSGADLHYRVRLTGLDDHRRRLGAGRGQAPHRTRHAPGHRDRRDVRFVWSGDLAGQGWGINPDLGGYRIFTAMAPPTPTSSCAAATSIYADGPLTETVALPDGRIWRNVVTPRRSRKVAETLAEYRGQLPLQPAGRQPARASTPSVPMHRPVGRPRGPSTTGTRARSSTTPATPRSAWTSSPPAPAGRSSSTPRHDAAAAAGTAASTGRSPTGRCWTSSCSTCGPTERQLARPPDRRHAGHPGRRAAGLAQARAVAARRPTWKVIAADLPLGLVVPDGDRPEARRPGRPGAPLGRELRDRRAALLHQAPPHHRTRCGSPPTCTTPPPSTTTPRKAAFTDFDPFWEFVSGPAQRGRLPGPTRSTAPSGRSAAFVKAPPRANASPAEGYQFFGEVDIDATAATLTVRLRDIDGGVLYTKALTPRR